MLRITPAAMAFSALALLSATAPAVAAGEILGPDAAACAPGSGRDAVLLTVNGFKNREGTLRVELWPGTEADFMRDHRELLREGKTYTRITLPVSQGGASMRVCVPLPGPGIYALGAFHSPTGVPKFNFRQDGATFTRNPKMGLRAPRAPEVAMQFNTGLNESNVTLNYLRGLSFRPLPKEELQTTGKR